jgi:hypothetical protein
MAFAESNPQIRQLIADAVDDLDEFGMRLLEAFDGRAQAADGNFAQLRILLPARRLVRGKFCELRDALRVLVVRLGKVAYFRFQRGEQLEQFALALVTDGIRAVNLRFNFANRFFNHVVKVIAAENSASAFTGARSLAKWAG